MLDAKARRPAQTPDRAALAGLSLMSAEAWRRGLARTLLARLDAA